MPGFESEHGTCSEYLNIKLLSDLSVGISLGALFIDNLIFCAWNLHAYCVLSLRGLNQCR